ncbi:MAG: hypothetical protein ACRCV9_07115 [Burkholderiaceae bacterium]
MMRVYIIAAIGAALLAALTLGYTSWRDDVLDEGRAEVQVKWDAEKAVIEQAAADALRDKARTEIRYADNKIFAEQARSETLKRISADRDRLGAESHSLREQIRAGRGAATNDSCAAQDARADTLGELLSACSQRYSDLAEKADGHAADAKALMDAWPK